MGFDAYTGKWVDMFEAGIASHTFKFTQRTKIWLDRSLLKQPTLDGTLADLKPGMKAEMRDAGPEKPQDALWVQVPASSS